MSCDSVTGYGGMRMSNAGASTPSHGYGGPAKLSIDLGWSHSRGSAPDHHERRRKTRKVDHLDGRRLMGG